MGRLLVLVLRGKVISILTGVYEGRLGELTFLNVAWTQAASQKRVSLLKFESSVSNFPVLETDGTVSSTFATEKSHFYFNVRLWEGV